MSSVKREAREFCLQFLYHFQLPVFKDLKSTLTAQTKSGEIFDKVQEFKETLNIDLNSEGQAFVTKLTHGLLNHLPEIEEMLVRYLKNWKLERVSKIEHTLLLMSIYELKYHPETPAKVVMNESIELAKKYATKEAGSFINGILDSIYKNELQK